MRNDKFNFEEKKNMNVNFVQKKLTLSFINICKVFASPFSYISSYLTETKFDPWV